MANVKKGNLTAPPQWWKHLRDWKRVFWKSERQAQKKDIKNEKDRYDFARILLNLLIASSLSWLKRSTARSKTLQISLKLKIFFKKLFAIYLVRLILLTSLARNATGRDLMSLSLIQILIFLKMRNYLIQIIPLLSDTILWGGALENQLTFIWRLNSLQTKTI